MTTLALAAEIVVSDSTTIQVPVSAFFGVHLEINGGEWAGDDTELFLFQFPGKWFFFVASKYVNKKTVL